MIILYSILMACLASFFYTLAEHLPKHDVLFVKRSCCNSCHHPLTWKELIPIFSFLFLKGKCAYCHHKIPKYYFILEIIAPILYLIFCIFYLPDQAALYCYLMMVLVLISYIDIREQLIYDSTLLLLIPIVIYVLIQGNILLHITYAIGSCLAFVLCNIIHHESFGGGDIKLVFVMGLILGNSIVEMLLASIIICGIYCYSLLIIKKAKRNDHIPFAPFLCLIFIIVFMLNY